MITQKWWQSKVTISALVAQAILIASLFVTAGQLTLLQVISGALVEIWTIVAIGNNPTNKVGWGPNPTA